MAYRSKGPWVPVDPEDIVLVASHSCDVVQRDGEKEPVVELLRARLIPDVEVPDGNLSHAKSPRLLQFRSSVTGRSAVYSALAHDRWAIPRGMLVGATSTTWLEKDVTSLVASWLARRYDRAALPDEFVDRARPANPKVLTALRHTNDLVTGLYVNLSSLAELPASVPYEVSLVATMKIDDYQHPDRVLRARSAVGDLEVALTSCQGIEVRDALVVSEDGLSLADLREWTRWELDYISLRSPAAVEKIAPRY